MSSKPASRTIILDNTNYNDWSYATQMSLTKARVWTVASGAEPRPLGSPNSKTVQSWVKRDEEAMARIVELIDTDQFHLTRKASTSAEAWENIRTFHTTNGLSTVITVFMGLFRNKRKANVLMRDHIGSIESTVQKLTDLGEVCSDRLVIAFILASLPAEYDRLIIALDSHPDHNKLDYVVTRILNEETRLAGEHESNYEAATSGALAASATRRAPVDRSTITCHKCGGIGHFRNKCGTFPFNLTPSTPNSALTPQASIAYAPHYAL